MINNSQNKNLLATGFISDALLEKYPAATSISVTSSSSAQYKYNAVFGRLNYNWQDKYLLNLSARRDGSSRFDRVSSLVILDLWVRLGFFRKKILSVKRSPF